MLHSVIRSLLWFFFFVFLVLFVNKFFFVRRDLDAYNYCVVWFLFGLEFKINLLFFFLQVKWVNFSFLNSLAIAMKEFWFTDLWNMIFFSQEWWVFYIECNAIASVHGCLMIWGCFWNLYCWLYGFILD